MLPQPLPPSTSSLSSYWLVYHAWGEASWGVSWTLCGFRNRRELRTIQLPSQQQACQLSLLQQEAVALCGTCHLLAWPAAAAAGQHVGDIQHFKCAHNQLRALYQRMVSMATLATSLTTESTLEAVHIADVQQRIVKKNQMTHLHYIIETFYILYLFWIQMRGGAGGILHQGSRSPLDGIGMCGIL